MKSSFSVPNVVLHTRARDESNGIRSPYAWRVVHSEELFRDKRAVLFSLPGAFTPTCSNDQLPGFEDCFDEFAEMGIDEIYCASVNDSFVMNTWAADLGIRKVKLIPDGSGEFTRKMGMLVDMANLGFGFRSWRYAAIVADGKIETWFEEPGREDNAPTDPYSVTTPQNVLAHLQTANLIAAQ